MDVLVCLCGVDDTWVGGVVEDLWVCAVQVAVHVAGVQQVHELGAAVLCVWTQVLVQVLDRVELGV